MAGRKIKDRDRIAYTFTLHTVKDAEMVKYLEDKPTTAFVKELVLNKMNNTLDLPPGKVLIDSNELLRLVSLVTGGNNIIQNPPIQSSNNEQAATVDQKNPPEKEKVYTEEQKKILSDKTSKIGVGIMKHREKK